MYYSYGASKAAINGFTRCLAVELGGKQIRVNCVEPGFIISDMTRGITDERKQHIMNSIPLQRFGACNDVASMICFLASPGSSYITGQTFRVDGGLSIH